MAEQPKKKKASKWPWGSKSKGSSGESYAAGDGAGTPNQSHRFRHGITGTGRSVGHHAEKVSGTAEFTTFPSVSDTPTPQGVEDVFRRWKPWTGNVWDALCSDADARLGQPIGVLELDVIEGFGLPASDFGVSSDPYVVATLTGYFSNGSEWPASMQGKFTTTHKSQTLYPVWNASAKFFVPRAGAVLRLEVFDRDAMDEDDKLGYTEVPLEALLSGKKVQPWLRLKVAHQFKEKLRKIKKAKRDEAVRSGKFAAGDETQSGLRDAEDEPVEDWHVEQESVDERDKGSFLSQAMSLDGDKMFKFLGSHKKASKLGEHACVHVALRLHYAPWGEALTGLLWPEVPFECKDTKFDIERTLTQVAPRQLPRHGLLFCFTAVYLRERARVCGCEL